MSDDYILVLATIRLLPTAQSGRVVPIKGSYRPNHNFFGPDNRLMTVGFIELPDGRELWPGETIDLPIKLWKWQGLDGEVYPGREWRIQEGKQHVGFGTVLKILEP